MSFGVPHWLWGLWLLPILVLLFFYSERRIARRLHDFVSPRLLPQLTASVDRFRRTVRFGLQLLTLAAAFAALAQPRWGYTFEEAKRKGIDLLIAVDTSRSMLSNDVQPNRLERVKLAAQDLITELQGDRVGLIAFAGRAFLQAPLTIDYSAAVDAINDLDTKTIPEGGTNISEAISLASRTYNKSAVGNRALVIFTDGEELNGDAVKAAKAAADAGIKIFTVGVGTSQGSLIPLAGDNGGTAFVKDDSGQVVKSKLDEKRLREIAEATGGFYLHLENGPQTMQHLFAEGLGKMTAKEMDVKLSRRPIERYEWPLGVAALALTLSLLMSDRKRARVSVATPNAVKLAPAAAAILLLSLTPASATVSGLNLYQDKKYSEAYQAFQEDLKNHPDSPDKDKMQFDAGAAAYQMRNYDKAAEAFSQALLTNDKKLQEGSHYNIGRTLEERADLAKNDDVALRDLENAQSHYEDVLKLNPNNAGAKANLDAVKKKIENLKNKRKQKPPPTPPPQQQQKQDKNQQDQGGGGGGGDSSKDNQQQQNKNQQNQNQGQGQNQANNQGGGGADQQQQNQDQQNQNKQDQKNRDQSQAKNDRQPNEQGNGGENPSPSPQGKSAESLSPSPGKGEKKEDNQGAGAENKPSEPSPTPGEEQGEASPSPSPGQGEGSGEGGASPSATPAPSPQKKFAGEIKGASQNQSPSPDQPPQMAQAEEDKEGEMSERQARALLDSSKNEEARVLLDERRAARRVYKDW